MARAGTLQEDIPESDRVPGFPHPRMARDILGQDAAIEVFLAAAAGRRLPHAWLLTGPRGVGKASFAWGAARWLLAGGGLDGFAPQEGHPALRRMQALAEPGLHLVRRSIDETSGRLRNVITVDEIRRLQGFFRLSAAGGGPRVAIIDTADEMNTQAANALLKILEEPPPASYLFLVSHRPAGLLATIRSRCHVLRFEALDQQAMAAVLSQAGAEPDSAQVAALTELSAGSAGEAMRLLGQGGLEKYQQIVDLFATMPRLDRQAAGSLAEAAAGRASERGDPFDLTVSLLDVFLMRVARHGLQGPCPHEAARGEAEVMARLCTGAGDARGWAEAQSELSAFVRAGRAVNLDPAALVMDMLMQLARGPAARGR